MAHIENKVDQCTIGGRMRRVYLISFSENGCLLKNVSWMEIFKPKKRLSLSLGCRKSDSIVKRARNKTRFI